MTVVNVMTSPIVATCKSAVFTTVVETFRGINGITTVLLSPSTTTGGSFDLQLQAHSL